MMNDPIGLYIHVPFCRRKCAYCDFYSLAASEDIIECYVKAVIRNIKAQSRRYDTVYFGGGTPTLLSAEQVFRILSAADIAEGAEISAEANPDSADTEKLSGFRSAGIDRLSVGVQSFDGRELAALGRLHSPAQAENAVKNARRAGFENISLDIMLGIPYQTAETLSETLKRTAELSPEHISAYMLKLEEGTPLAEDPDLINKAADSDTLADLYLQTVNSLEGFGYGQYEISNFSKKGFECRHNLKYWRCEDYIGIGAAAHSCADGKRFAVPRDMVGFIDNERQPVIILDDDPCTTEEKMMLSLRLAEGFPISEAGENSERILKAAKPLEANGFLTIGNGSISLTAKGFLVSNEIICRLTDIL